MRQIVLVSAFFCLIGSGLPSFGQAMSKSNDTNPTTNGYATSGAAIKDQNSKGPTTEQPVGTSAAETAGASSANPKAQIRPSSKTPRTAKRSENNYGSNSGSGNNASNASAEPSANAADKTKPVRH